jgi:beta-phosphoglucomutase family hydrolase
MSHAMPKLTEFDAVLFDLDGVLTPTAAIHSAAWKQMFDEFLDKWSRKTGVAQDPFDVERDYLEYVDGKARVDGVRSFLDSRGIELPEGEADAPPRSETVAGLGNRKNVLVTELLETEGVDAFPGSVALVEELRRAGVDTGVVSSSKNCEAVLEAAGIADLFSVRVDGLVAAELGLPGKPEPDTFLAAASRIGATPADIVVVEDAIAGVQAGRAGGFGLVVGVDRVGQRQALLENGADVVVDDLAELVDGGDG